MTGCAIRPERVGFRGRRAHFKYGRFMGFDRGRKGDRGGRGRDKRESFGGEESFAGDLGGGFQERSGYGGGGGRISATNLRIEGEPMVVERSGGGSAGAAGGGGGPQRQLTGEKASGTVKFFNAMKGFGFIQRDDGQPDAFVHISAVERAGTPTLNEGDRLEFELEVDRRGKYAAVNLQPKSD